MGFPAGLRTAPLFSRGFSGTSGQPRSVGTLFVSSRRLATRSILRAPAISTRPPCYQDGKEGLPPEGGLAAPHRNTTQRTCGPGSLTLVRSCPRRPLPLRGGSPFPSSPLLLSYQAFTGQPTTLRGLLIRRSGPVHQLIAPLNILPKERKSVGKECRRNTASRVGFHPG